MPESAPDAVPQSAPGDARPAPITTLGQYLRHHWPTVAGVFGGSGLGALGIQALAAWAPVLALRRFGASAQQVGEGIGAAYMLGTASGALLGALGVKLLRPHTGAATPLRVLGLGTGLAALVAAALPLAGSALQVYVLFGLQVSCLIAGTVVAPTLLQDMSPAALRSRVIALAAVATTLLGALSPVLVGLVSDALQQRDGALALAVAGVSGISMALGALATWRAERHFVRTVGAVAAGEVAPIHPPASPSPSPSPSHSESPPTAPSSPSEPNRTSHHV